MLILNEKELGTLAERIEAEEVKTREGNIGRLEEFLTRAEGNSISVDYHGIRFFKELFWTYSMDRKQIVLSCKTEMCGLHEIDIDEILSVGYPLFSFDQDTLVVENVNDTMVLSID